MPTQKYTKRPEVFEAISAAELLDAAAHDWDAMPEWIRGAYDVGDILFADDEIKIKHPAAELTAKGDDMIVNHPQALVINVLDKDSFDALYQAAQ